MKKIYLQPEVEVEQMVLEQMLAESIDIDGNTSIDPSEADSRLFESGAPFNQFE